LVRPGGGRNGFDSLKGYCPLPGKDFPRGQTILNNGGRDFFGRAVLTNQPPSVGAAEEL